jgi:hypothetical protein
VECLLEGLVLVYLRSEVVEDNICEEDTVDEVPPLVDNRSDEMARFLELEVGTMLTAI